jgi:hypothetical protein
LLGSKHFHRPSREPEAKLFLPPSRSLPFSDSLCLSPACLLSPCRCRGCVFHAQPGRRRHAILLISLACFAFSTAATEAPITGSNGGDVAKMKHNDHGKYLPLSPISSIILDHRCYESFSLF